MRAIRDRNAAGGRAARAALALFLLIICLAVVPGRGAADTLRQEMLAAINDKRTSHGLQPLTLEERLSRAAQTHAEDIAARGRLDHRGADGSGLADRLVRVGYPYGVAAENVAGGTPTAADTVELWMESQGHRRNLLRRDILEAGVGYASRRLDPGDRGYRHFWVVDLGRRR